MTTTTGVSSDVATRTVYATDNSIFQIRPAAVAFPASAREVVDLLAANRASVQPLAVVARGGGTGTNGQALTDGLVLDLKRRLNRIREIDVDRRIAVVEPGVVAGHLNAELDAHRLRWAPHASTINRATVGGMIATDAAGKGSAVHGRTHRHVAAVDLCLADGTEIHLAPTPLIEAQRRAGVESVEGRLWRSLIDLRIPPPDRLGLPEGLGRAFTGYGIERLRYRGLDQREWIDPVQLVVGAEGTLGVVTKAWLRLIPQPTRIALAALAYRSFAEALVDSLRLTERLAPTAVEVFDEHTLEAARHSPHWSSLADLAGVEVGSGTGAVLLVEFEDADADDVVDQVEAASRAVGVGVASDAETRQAVWRVRADAVGLLAGRVDDRGGRQARPVAFVEDCAVPPSAMPSFIAEFRSLLDAAGLRYGMFGHADVGCVHVRPSLDLTDEGHRGLAASLTGEVADLVAAYGGVLWGEHGRGFRSDHVDRYLPPATTDLMRQVKSAFDPLDLCNPGKLYRPIGSSRPLVSSTEAPLRADSDRTVPVAIRGQYSSAFACNGNGLCHDHDPARSMCPSWAATGDPALSPKGRADLLRARLAATGPEREALDTALVDNLDDCLSCSACAGMCPVSVDIPELKSRFLAEYYRNRTRPLRHRVLSRLESLAPRLVGLPTPLTRLAVAPVERVLGLVSLPTPVPRLGSPRSGLAPFNPGSGRSFDVVVLADVFTTTLDPAVAECAALVLEAAGRTVATTPVLATGKFDYNVGRRTRFARAAARQRRTVEEIVQAGARPITIEPAVAMLHRHEYPIVSSGYPSDRLTTLADELARAVEGGFCAGTAARTETVKLFGHCTEQALAPDQTQTWARILTAAGFRVELVSAGCCGMAGAFGYDRSKQDLSRRLWDQTWAGPVAQAGREPATVVAATGYSCRSQAARFGHATLRHPIEILAGVLVRGRQE